MNIKNISSEIPATVQWFLLYYFIYCVCVCGGGGGYLI